MAKKDYQTNLVQQDIKYWIRIPTAIKVPGRKTMVNTAMVFIAELSRLDAKAIAFIVELSRALALARWVEAWAIFRFR
jgi:hypothetical protein